MIGESEGDVREVFALKAAKENAPIRYADDEHPFGEALIVDEGILYRSTPYGDLTGELSGECQPKNAATILVAVDELRKMGWHITKADVKKGFAQCMFPYRADGALDEAWRKALYRVRYGS